LTLLAAEQWLMAGDVQRATNAFASVERPAEGEARWLWDSLDAAFALRARDTDRALAILEPLARQPLPQDYRVRIDGLRADAWFQSGDPVRAVRLLLQREAWLGSARERERNRERLWRGLVDSNPELLRGAADVESDPVVRGWLTIGALAASTGRQGLGWSNGVARWREAYPAHAANSLLDDLDIPAAGELDYPRQIALLLPLSGNTASAGLAVQNGFLGAYFAAAGGLDTAVTSDTDTAAGSGRDNRQTVRVYDVVAEGGASAAYGTAVEEGADFVVGPLLRQSVTELANDILVPVPVLTLNYLDDDTLAPPGLYQFSLAPEDEAAAAAQRAILDGHTRALALVPNNGWGRRLFTSFATTFESLGGTVLDSRSYTTGNPDFSSTIEDLMGLSGSVKRYQRLRANIGGPLQFDPRRRQDAEFIFLAADAPAGRLLKSQLKFHYSGDLPVYATSSIYAMDGRSDSDLNGVMFADAPWVVDPQPWISSLPPLFEEHWPEHRRLARLHAMGYDAYHLIGALFAAQGDTFREIDGATGRLYLDDAGRVHRYLAWARFERGEPVPLPDPDPFLIPGSTAEDDYSKALPAGVTDDAQWADSR
ncbi:MAG TPA: penicillin-binding protein activator, partial [Woeseiaceae bacterium]|nr:penicillin-binding protein activator [Woeseiaceae bacterium]